MSDEAITPGAGMARPVGALAGFPLVLRSEWTKLRTVRGWVIGLGATALVMVLLAVMAAAGTTGGPGAAITGPDGTGVIDRFSFVHRSLDGDGTISVRVSDLTGTGLGGQAAEQSGSTNGAEPWAKAGLLVKDGTMAGSTYAAVMVTGSHGVRMQHDFTGDTAGSIGGASADQPVWLRLSRNGSTVTGFESADGTTWTEVGSVDLGNLPASVEAGVFVTSPPHLVTELFLGGIDVNGGQSFATAEFGDLTVDGAWSEGAWALDQVGEGLSDADLAGDPGSGAFTLSGSGDIAPAVSPHYPLPEQGLLGAFAALIAVGVVAAMFATAEYRHGLTHLTIAATPRRRQVLAAKAVVIGSVTFVVGLMASAVALPVSTRLLANNNAGVVPISAATELRLVVGTAALLAVAAVLAVALGTALRRSMGAVVAVVAAIVLPYIAAVGSLVPVGPAEWLLRVTPAAAFAVQQSIPDYPQVAGPHVPAAGYFPLSPAAGFAVLCGWTAIALVVAARRIDRLDA